LQRLLTRLGVGTRVRSLEDRWFDATRSVRTIGDTSGFDTARTVGDVLDSQPYIPVRVATARAAMRNLPVRDDADYTFVDMGSGKGRMLFVAAERPFRQIRGVEFVVDLHEQARKNIGTYRHRTQRCADIESINADAATYEFPDGNLVIYLFNPFGPGVLQPMLQNLQQSIDRRPRHVIVLLLWPVHGALVAAMPAMRSYQQTRRYHIYQTEQG
jgi:hypothetical protein